MRFSDKLKARIDEAWNTVTEEIRQLRADELVRTNRYHICIECEHYFEPTGSCLKCGCFVRSKTWLPKARCPLGKWDVAEPDNNE